MTKAKRSCNANSKTLLQYRLRHLSPRYSRERHGPAPPDHDAAWNLYLFRGSATRRQIHVFAVFQSRDGAVMDFVRAVRKTHRALPRIHAREAGIGCDARPAPSLYRIVD